MDWIEALALAVLQGLTEFLPVSSSGHLAVAGRLFAILRGEPIGTADDAEAGGLFFAVMLHVGTLGAIVVYYRRTALASARGFIDGGGEDATPTRRAVVRAALLAVVATLPAVVVGLTLKDAVEEAFTSLAVPGFGFLVTATLLYLTSRGGERAAPKGPAETSWLDALLVGLAQAMAITPGISRSGSTIAAALALGFSRTWAVGFSLLMAVPAILGAAVLEIKDLDPSTLTADRLLVTGVATVVSGLVGYGAIVWLVRVVRSGRLWYFSVYLILAAVATLALAAFTDREGRPTAASPGAEVQAKAGEITDGQGRRSDALDRAAGLGLDRPGAGRGRPGDLDRPDPAGPRPARPPAGAGEGVAG